MATIKAGKLKEYKNTRKDTEINDDERHLVVHSKTHHETGKELKIYFAKITCNIIKGESLDKKAGRAQKKKEIICERTIEMIYKQDEEKNINSYFMIRLKTLLQTKDSQSFEITKINKIKKIGFAL